MKLEELRKKLSQEPDPFENSSCLSFGIGNLLMESTIYNGEEQIGRPVTSSRNIANTLSNAAMDGSTWHLEVEHRLFENDVLIRIVIAFPANVSRAKPLILPCKRREGGNIVLVSLPMPWRAVHGYYSASFSVREMEWKAWRG